MLNGLKLFVADVVDEYNGEQTIWYVVDITYNSAFKRFVKEANKTWDRYLYYFDEADNETVENFIEMNGDVGAGIYD